LIYYFNIRHKPNRVRITNFLLSGQAKLLCGGKFWHQKMYNSTIEDVIRGKNREVGMQVKESRTKLSTWESDFHIYLGFMKSLRMSKNQRKWRSRGAKFKVLDRCPHEWMKKLIRKRLWRCTSLAKRLPTRKEIYILSKI